MAPLGRAGDAFLQLAHLRGQRRLITDGAGHTAQKRGHFRAGLREAEDVVDEQQRVGPGRVAEPLAHGQGRQGHAQTGAGRLVHLAEHHGRLRDDRAVGLADLGFLHFQPEVVAFAGALADAGEHGVAAVLAGDAGDQFGEDDGLAQAGAAEQAGLAAADQRRQQVDDLDAGLEEFGLGRQLAKGGGSRWMGRYSVGIDRAAAVDRLAEQVEDAAERLLADRHRAPARRCRRPPCRGPGRRSSRGRRSGRDCRPGAAALRRSGGCVTPLTSLSTAQGVVDFGQMAFLELDVEGRADDLHDLAGMWSLGRSVAVRQWQICHRQIVPSISSASTPPMTSAISLVICAWRARLYLPRQAS